MTDIDRLLHAVTGEPDHQAISAFLSTSLGGGSGALDHPTWGGPDAGPHPLAQTFNLARGSVGANELAVTLRPIAIADSVYFDSATPSITGVYIPGIIDHGTECRLAIDFDQYPMPVSAAASGGGTTATSASGGGTPATSASGGAGTSGGGSHNHTIALIVSSTPGGYAARHYTDGAGGVNLDLATAGNVNLASDGDYPAHTHGTPNHTHDTTIAGHTHDTTVPNHTHVLTATASKESYPASHSVNLAVYKLVTGSWVQQGATITGITTDAPDIDLSAYITGSGRWRLVLQSAAAQPNGGRLGAHLSGYFVGVIPN